MPVKQPIPPEVRKTIRELVKLYKDNKGRYESVVDIIHTYITKSPELKPFIHSTKSRVKDPDHLKDKLERKYHESIENGKVFNIHADNLFTEFGDLAGYRFLHLHTSQLTKLIPALKSVLDLNNCPIVEGPFAYTWDEETRQTLENIGIATEYNDELYTSVHIIVEINPKTNARCEIQIRTLMEELWGEVSHTVNYPHKTKSSTCREQLKVLARIASGGSRLVDSIFHAHEEYVVRNKKVRRRKLSPKK